MSKDKVLTIYHVQKDIDSVLERPETLEQIILDHNPLTISLEYSLKTNHGLNIKNVNDERL